MRNGLPVRAQLISHFSFLISLSWSWRESNPRPNRETIRFLHAYSGLRFSCCSKTRTTNYSLIL